MEIHGKLVDIHNQTIFAATVTVEGGQIADVRRNSHRGHLFIIPGLFDAHAHLETTHMIPSEFARIAIRHGTVATTFATRHLSRVMGPEGMRQISENAARLPFKSQFPDPNNTQLSHCSTLSEARARHAEGENVLVHTVNLPSLLPMLNEDPRSCLFCSSHTTPDRFVLGHINLLIKRAIELGADPIDAITCGTYREEPNAGLLRVGDPADFALVENLETFRTLETYIDGIPIFKGGPLLPRAPFSTPKSPKRALIQPKDLHIPETEGEISVLCINGEGPPVEKQGVCPTIHRKRIISDPERDILKYVCIDKSGKVSVQFLEGIGIKRGTLASSYSGSLVAIGTTDTDITAALNTLIESGGGLCVCNQGKIDLFPLPIAGLFSPLDGEEIAVRHSNLEIAAKTLGTPLQHPFFPLRNGPLIW